MCTAQILTDNLVNFSPTEMKFTMKSIYQEINVVYVWNYTLSVGSVEMIAQPFCLMYAMNFS